VRQEPVQAVAPAKREISEGEKQFWTTQLAMVWNSWAGPRKWQLMPGAPVDPETGLPKPPTDPAVFQAQVGEPLVRTLDVVFPMIDQRPWLQLLLVTTPFWASAMKVEAVRAVDYVNKRRAAAQGRAPGGPGTDGTGQNSTGDVADQELSPGLVPPHPDS